MDILLVAGGSPENWPKIKITDYDFRVGVDRGSLYLLENNNRLNLAVGDFDSLTKEEYKHVVQQAEKVIQAQPEKDSTDTQLALAWVFEQFPEAKVTIIGATGGRLDHFLSNLWLPLEDRFKPFAQQIRLLDAQNTITYYLPGKYTVIKEAEMKYLAYVCLTPVENLTLEESNKYTLNQVDVIQPISYASNEFVGETAIFSFDTGIVSVIQSRDK